VRIRVRPYEVRVWKINDMEFPGLEFDYERWGVLFEWKKMYSLFFREEGLRIHNPDRPHPVIAM